MSTKPSLAHRLYTGDLSYDFVGKRTLWYIVSAIVVAACLLIIALRGLNLSIDFTGGSEFSVSTPVTASTVEDYREATEASGLDDLGDIKVNTIGDDRVRIQVRALSANEINEMTAHLAGHAGVEAEQVTNNLIGPYWGQQITQQGIIALVIFLALVALMIAIYFRNWKMSVAAMIALLHDLVLTIGVYSILQFPFTPATLIGVLTILGYSLYDTVVVFDKVRDNLADLDKERRTFGHLVNLAINQVLVRSINTTLIGVLPVAALLIAGVFILGSGPLQDLGLAMFVGMIAGAYSSIFLAAPMFAHMKQNEPDIVAHDKRAAKRSAHARRSEETPEQAEAAPAVLSTMGTQPVDPSTLGVVRADELQRRQQPRHTSRADRKKDGR
ncbi:MAG: protein translocase subunit SecF [Propionibacteriaceae bacterium]|nr:protein translocase subunit SecF [Propionibacteriaceae bacterium]